MLGLLNSWAGFYWYQNLINDSIIVGDKGDIRLNDKFQAQLVQPLPSPANGTLLLQMKE
jgi:hypothetical protein